MFSHETHIDVHISFVMSAQPTTSTLHVAVTGANQDKPRLSFLERASIALGLALLVWFMQAEYLAPDQAFITANGIGSFSWTSVGIAAVVVYLTTSISYVMPVAIVVGCGLAATILAQVQMTCFTFYWSSQSERAIIIDQLFRLSKWQLR